MLPWPNSGVRINRLRVRSTGEPIVTRLRAERALASGARRPESLPPEAVLCIRRLTDPRPGLLPLQAGRDAPFEWSSAVAGRVNDAAARAVRPSLDAVTADAEAVLFADRAELLACLALDACERRIGGRWWWRSLFGDVGRVWRVADVWRDEPRAIAAAFDLLAARGRAVHFAGELREDDTRAVLAAMLPAHGFAADLAGNPVAETSPAPLKDDSGDAGLQKQHFSRGGMSTGLPPWHEWAPEASSAPELRIDQRRLLGLALTLRRAPSPLLTPAFVAAALEWEPKWDAAASEKPLTEAGRRRPGPARERTPLTPWTAAAFVEADDTAPETRAAVTRGRLSRAPDVPDQGDVVRAASWLPDPREDARAPMRSSEPHAPAPSETDGVPPRTHATDVCRTAYGGVLFLLNLGIRLGLYGDFTTPLQPGIALSIWDFVTIAGRRLAGPHVDEDPLWNLLALLAHRDVDDEPGAGFELPAEWRVSREWLRPFARVEGPWRWTTTSGRVLVRHPAGFVALDVARSSGETAVEQARREVATLAGDSQPALRPWRPGPRARRPLRPLDMWSDRLIAFAGARLAAAMPGQTARSAGRLLCRLPASVLLTPAHLHAVFQLNALPIEVRVSGLDRNPGWIPAAGRTVTFAFE